VKAKLAPSLPVPQLFCARPTIDFFFRRSFAYLTDSFLVLIFVRPVTFAQHLFGDLSDVSYLALQLLATVITAVYIVGFHARWGWTIGKLVVGLRVATLDGIMPPPLKNAFIRWLPMLVAGNLPWVISVLAPPSWSYDIYSHGKWHANAWQTIALLWVLADIVGALLSRSRRSLHDMLAHTVVTERPPVAGANRWPLC
jgi:uncharacterized RDD family membrane protein YckC